jgi:hypothetical protein
MSRVTWVTLTGSLLTTVSVLKVFVSSFPQRAMVQVQVLKWPLRPSRSGFQARKVVGPLHEPSRTLEVSP